MSALLKPLPELLVTVSLGRDHPADDSHVIWESVQMTRQELADMLRDARYHRGERRHDTSICPTLTGYSIYDWRR